MDFPDNASERIMSTNDLKKATVSIWTTLRDFWQRPDVKQYRLEGFVILTGLLLGSMLVLGSLRQRTARSDVRFCLRAAFYLSGHALSYVMGIMNDSPVRNGLVVLWAVILLVLYGTADNVGTESLGDNEGRRKRFLWDYMIPTLWFLALLVFTVPPQRFWIPVLFLLVLFLLKLRERKLALMCACRSRVGIDRVTRVIAEYMKNEHTLSISEDANPTTMQGYKYLVGVKEAVREVVSKKPPRYEQHLDLAKIITMDEIWQCEEWLLASSGKSDGYLKDTCLSFALFWLLLRRFADYDLAELSNEASRLKTWNFVRHGLIKESDDEEACERTFRVVEVELDFIYDYFYNNYYAVYSTGGTRYLLVRLAVVAVYFVVSIVTLTDFSPADRHSRPSKWVKVKWVCSYIQDRWWWQKKRGRCLEWLLYMATRAPCLRPWCKPWQKKLRQYSLLDSYGHTPNILWFKWLFDGYLDLPTDGQKENRPELLSADVEKAVLESPSWLA